MTSPASFVLIPLLLLVGVSARAQCPGPPISCDTPITAGIDVIGETDYLSFDVTDGDAIEISMARVSGPGFAVQWRIVDANCNPVPGPCGAFRGDVRVDCVGLSAADNPHSIEIVDSGNDATGTYTVGLQRLSSSTACDDTPLTCDEAVVDSLESRVGSDLFSFDVSGTEHIEITVADVGGAGFDPWWRILDGSGVPVPGACGSYAQPLRRTCALSDAGNPYRIEIVEIHRDATGIYALHIQRLVAACDESPIECDVAVSDSITSRVESDLFSFDVTGMEEIEITVRDAGGLNFDPWWRVLDGSGLPVPGACGSYAEPLRRTCTLSDAGNPYRIEIVEINRDATGIYELHIQRLVAATACDEVPIECDVAVADSITSRVESDLFSFDVTGVEEIEVTVRDAGGLNFDPWWRVLDGSGLPVPGACGSYAEPLRRSCTLSDAGNPYRIEIVEINRDATGTYELHIQRLAAAMTCDDVRIRCDVAEADSITSRVESDLFSFEVLGTEVVEITVADVSGANFDPWWRVIDGLGVPVPGGCGSYAAPMRRTCTLPESGSPYRVEVVEINRDAVGTYELHLQRLTSTSATCDDIPIECDVTVRDSIRSQVESNLYSFSVSGTEEVEITVADVGGANFDPWWRMLNGDGSPLEGGCGDYAAPSRRTCTLSELNNPYRLEIVEVNRNATGVYELHMQRLVAAVACDDVPIVCDVAVTDSITSRVESDLFSFEVVGTEEIEVTVVDIGGAEFDPWWRVLDGLGVPVAGPCGGYSAPMSRTCTFSDIGNPYRVEIAEIHRNAVGLYEVSITGCATIGVGTSTSVPKAFALAIRGPHPLRGGANAHYHYDVPEPGADVSIDLYDVTGRLVARMVEGHISAGSHTGVIGDPRGATLGAGVYFLRMETPSYHATRSVVFLK